MNSYFKAAMAKRKQDEFRMKQERSMNDTNINLALAAHQMRQHANELARAAGLVEGTPAGIAADLLREQGRDDLADKIAGMLAAAEANDQAVAANNATLAKLNGVVDDGSIPF
jgi:hypothetical protein